MDIVVTFNTLTKACTATVGGKPVENLSYANFYSNYRGKFSCEITSGTMDEDNDVGSYTRVCASEGGDTLVDKSTILNKDLRQEILDSCK